MNGQFTPESFAEKAQTAGYRWAALELDDFGNEERWPAYAEACEAVDVLPGAWVTEGAKIAEVPLDASFAIAECEGPGDYDGIMAAIKHQMLPSCPKAIITNFGGLIVKDANEDLLVGGETNVPASRARAAPLVDAGFECLTEVYIRDDAGNPTGKTAESMDFIAREQLGFARSQPVFGIFGGATLPDYAQWFGWPGWSVYPIEAVL